MYIYRAAEILTINDGDKSVSLWDEEIDISFTVIREFNFQGTDIQ